MVDEVQVNVGCSKLWHLLVNETETTLKLDVKVLTCSKLSAIDCSMVFQYNAAYLVVIKISERGRGPSRIARPASDSFLYACAVSVYSKPAPRSFVCSLAINKEEVPSGRPRTDMSEPDCERLFDLVHGTLAVPDRPRPERNGRYRVSCVPSRPDPANQYLGGYVPSFNSMLSQVMMESGAPQQFGPNRRRRLACGISESSVPHSIQVLGTQGYLYRGKCAVVRGR